LVLPDRAQDGGKSALAAFRKKLMVIFSPEIFTKNYDFSAIFDEAQNGSVTEEKFR
jgi:hypothetical protein